MSAFANDLSALLAKEARASMRDPDRMAEMVERIAAGLGFTVAMACGGDGAAIDKMLIGAEAHAHAEAVNKSELGRLMRMIGAHS